jgi:pyruvate dehydrogenase E1 component alpha subunit
LGTGLTHQTRKTGKVTVVFNTNAENPVWLDALQAARAHRLPMIFVHSSDGMKPALLPNAAKLEPGTELPHIVTDGDDVVAMYRAAHESIGRARRNSGPTLIECSPFRLKGRRRLDSVAGMENYLRSKGLLRRGLRQELLEEIARESNSAKKKTKRA